MYLATGLTEVARPDLGDDEEADLTTSWIPLTDAVAMVLAGEVVNGATAAAVLAVHAIRTTATTPRPLDAPWPDRPTRFARRKES